MRESASETADTFAESRFHRAANQLLKLLNLASPDLPASGLVEHNLSNCDLPRLVIDVETKRTPVLRQVISRLARNFETSIGHCTDAIHQRHPMTPSRIVNTQVSQTMNRVSSSSTEFDHRLRS